MAMTSTRKLTAEDWAQAALDALAVGGLSAVAVEPLATRLGTTKGSFYWHFDSRGALVEAALRRWEAEHTEGVIALLADEPDPARRLRRLLGLVVSYSRHDRIELALLGAVDDPLVADSLRRATDRRIGYVAEQYALLGHPRRAAERRAVTAVSVYLGHLQLSLVGASALPGSDRAWRTHVNELVDLLVEE